MSQRRLGSNNIEAIPAKMPKETTTQHKLHVPKKAGTTPTKRKKVANEPAAEFADDESARVGCNRLMNAS